MGFAMLLILKLFLAIVFQHMATSCIAKFKTYKICINIIDLFRPAGLSVIAEHLIISVEPKGLYEKHGTTNRIKITKKK